MMGIVRQPVLFFSDMMKRRVGVRSSEYFLNA
jgi:hypothetical protein